jgi:hypothetical protein
MATAFTQCGAAKPPPQPSPTRSQSSPTSASGHSRLQLLRSSPHLFSRLLGEGSGSISAMVGVGSVDWVRRPLPPNRTCGSPASGSPVDGSPARGLADKTQASCKPKSRYSAKRALGVPSLTPVGAVSSGAGQKRGSLHDHSWCGIERLMDRSGGVVALTGNAAGSVRGCGQRGSIFLHPLAPRRYPASSLLRVLRLLLAYGLAREQVSLLHATDLPSPPSPTTDPLRWPLYHPGLRRAGSNPSAPSASVARARV